MTEVTEGRFEKINALIVAVATNDGGPLDGLYLLCRLRAAYQKDVLSREQN